jgi:protein Mpv17
MASLALLTCSSAFLMSARPLVSASLQSTARVPTMQMSFLDFSAVYQNALSTHYYETTCLQAGVLGSIGDVLAQALERPAATETKKACSLDWQRTLRTGMLGVVIGGLGDAMWLRYLEEPGLFEPILRAFDGHGVTLDADSLLVVIKTTLDAFVWAPIANSLYLVLTPLSEGTDLAGIVHSLDDNFLPVMQSEWSVFLPYNLVAFAFLPPFIRPFTTGLVSMFFSTYLSWITHLEPKVQQAAEGLGEGMVELLVPLGSTGGKEGPLTMVDGRDHGMARDARKVVAAMDRIDAAAHVVLAMDAIDAERAAHEARGTAEPVRRGAPT